MATAAGPTLPAQGMMTSDELDWLVYAYLEESGYHHTSFSLLTESNLAPPASSKPRGDSDTLPNGDRPTEHQPPPPPPTRNPVMDQVVPPGHLVRLLQKALLYLEAEARYRRDPTTAIPRIVGYPIPTTLPLPPLPKYVPPPAPAAPPAKEPSPAPAPPPALKPSETSKKGKGRAKATTAAVPPPAAAAAAPAEESGPAEPPAPAPTKKAKKKALAGPTSATNESGSVRKPKLPASEGSSRPGSSAGGGAGANDARAGAVGFSSSKGKERAVEQSAPSTGAETAAAATDAAGDVRMHEASAEDPQVNGRRLSGSSSTTTKREKTKDKSAPTAGGGSAPPSTAPAAATSSKTGTGSKREREKDDLRPPPAKKAAASPSAAPGAASGTSSTAGAAPDATKRSASPSIPRKSKSSGASESAPAPSSSTTGAPSSASLTSALASNSHTSNANSNSNPNKFRITTTTRTVSTPVSAMSSPSLAATASASSGLGGGGAGGGTQAPVSAAQLAADKRRRGSGEQAAASPSSGSGSGSGKDANAPASASDRLLQVKTEVADASAGGGGGKGDSRRDRSGASSLGTHALGGAMGKNGLGAVPRSPVKPPSPLKEFDMRGVREIRDDDARVVRLKGHTVSKVQPCAFNSKVPSLLATGGGDSTCRIWDVPPYSSASVDGAAAAAQTTVTDHIVCKHQSAQRRCDITCVAWDPSGSLLATGSEDGIVRIWTPSGDLHLVLSMHQRQVCSLKWNPRGTMLLTSSLDQTVCLWEVSNGKVRQQYATHADTVLDVDWNDDHTWASASMDKTVHLMSLTRTTPLHRFRGHRDEVNVVKFSPCGTLVASCSDDSTVRVWSLRNIAAVDRDISAKPVKKGDEARRIDVDEDDGGPGGVFVLEGHESDVHQIAWHPEAGKPASTGPRLLASCSFDSTARLWDADAGTCLYTFSRASDFVYSIQFEPGSGRHVATGSNDGRLDIYRVEDRALVTEYTHSGPIYEITWHPHGQQIAVCGQSDIVGVVGFEPSRAA